MLHKQSCTADKGWSSNLRAVHVADPSSTKEAFYEISPVHPVDVLFGLETYAKESSYEFGLWNVKWIIGKVKWY